MTRPRAVRIGLALNSRDRDYAPELANQYTSRTTRDDVAGALAGLGAEVVEVEADAGLFARLAELAGTLDLVFNLAEGLPHCRSRQVTVPMALDHLGLEWTGSLVEGHLVAANKALARRVLGDRVAQPRWWQVATPQAPLPGEVGFPVLVKPLQEGFSAGINEASVATSRAQLRGALRRLGERMRGPFLVEGFLDGMEYSIGLVGDVVLPGVCWDLRRMPGQPRVRGEELKRADLTIPHARLVEDPEVAESLARQAVTAHLELGLRDYSRSDFRALGPSPAPFFLETNSMPGLQNQQSVLTWAAAQAGVAYQDVIGSIAGLALRRLPPAHWQGLDLEPFEAAYRRLWEHAGTARVIRVGGREFRRLAATGEPVAEAALRELAAPSPRSPAPG